MKKTTHRKIGKALRALREQRGFTQEQLAAASGVHVRSLISYERDHVSPKVDTVFRIIGVFGVSGSAFFSEVAGN
jgi:transcriptional regulator with XRE-family HTH domain